MMEEQIKSEFSKLSELFLEMRQSAGLIRQAAETCIEALRAGKKLIFCGNGGSAADAQHLAAEMIGRYKLERGALPAIALSADTSVLTAVANDYGYALTFRRQIDGLGATGDVLVAMSTSGNSPNVVEAVVRAKEKGLHTVGLTGSGGGRLAELCDLAIRAPAQAANTVQELHIAVGHVLCDLIESAIYHDKSALS